MQSLNRSGCASHTPAGAAAGRAIGLFGLKHIEQVALGDRQRDRIAQNPQGHGSLLAGLAFGYADHFRYELQGVALGGQTGDLDLLPGSGTRLLMPANIWRDSCFVESVRPLGAYGERFLRAIQTATATQIATAIKAPIIRRSSK